MYAAQSDIVKAYGEDILYPSIGDDGLLDDAKVSAAIEKAVAEIDSYLGIRYTLPLPSIPERLVEICIDFAVYKMTNTADALTDDIKARYKDGLSWLKDVGAGRASLGLPTPAGKTSARPVTIKGAGRLFTRDKMRSL
ncbi:MAG: DUF1320 domain-containing protein [Robiginitomaculum sp.]|nr:DUF1320 domain-containing protein [Robiginitomaculum sp.]